MKTIKYCIDSVSVEEDNLIIVGWAYSSCKLNVKVSLVGIEDYTIETVDRIDLFDRYGEEEEALKAGFKIKLKYRNKVNIMFTADNEKELYKMNVKRMLNPKSKINKVRNYINRQNIKKVVNSTKKYGLKETYYIVKGKLRGSKSVSGIDYNEWYREKLPSEIELQRQREYNFEYKPKISIVVPTYNTKREFLIDMIESVVNQTYSNWELCIADGASTLEETIEILKEYDEKYENIKIIYLKDNYMISGNTNEALKLVTGDYVGLFDHDDILTPDAIFEVVKVLNDDKTVDFIYSDEDKTDENKSEYFDPNFKPDWSPDTLRSYNYITHFTVFSKKLLDCVGNFDSQYDGAQDYDMFLRLTEKANKIVHISKILYHWRVHRASTAGGIGAKNYAIESATRALQSHLERIGIEGEVKQGKFLSSYKVEYKIIGNPKVSIIIPNKDNVSTLKKCINSIKNKTKYTNYEIIVVENNSEEKKTFKYYDEISKSDNIKVIKWTKGFNYSAINNFAVKNSEGEYIVLLNNDIEIISCKWIEEMLMHA